MWGPLQRRMGTRDKVACYCGIAAEAAPQVSGCHRYLPAPAQRVGGRVQLFPDHSGVRLDDTIEAALEQRVDDHEQLATSLPCTSSASSPSSDKGPVRRLVYVSHSSADWVALPSSEPMQRYRKSSPSRPSAMSRDFLAAIAAPTPCVSAQVLSTRHRGVSLSLARPGTSVIGRGVGPSSSERVRSLCERCLSAEGDGPAPPRQNATACEPCDGVSRALRSMRRSRLNMGPRQRGNRFSR